MAQQVCAIDLFGFHFLDGLCHGAECVLPVDVSQFNLHNARPRTTTSPRRPGNAPKEYFKSPELIETQLNGLRRSDS
jgi:hypothetical protein